VDGRYDKRADGDVVVSDDKKYAQEKSATNNDYFSVILLRGL